jgi:hypothetical protein
MRHLRNISLAVAVVLCIVVALILAVGAVQPSSDGAAGALPAARQGLVENLKEVNYYPAAGGWTYMWSHLDLAAIDRDFSRIRSLDANAVRIIVQPSFFGFPIVHPVMANRLFEVMGLATKHSLRVQLTLFDWWSRYTDIHGSKEWVSSLLSRYRHDPRIAVLELQNEVDPQNPAAMAWVTRLLPYLATVMPGTLRTVSSGSVPPDVFALFTHGSKFAAGLLGLPPRSGGGRRFVLAGSRAIKPPSASFRSRLRHESNPGDQATRKGTGDLLPGGLPRPRRWDCPLRHRGLSTTSLREPSRRARRRLTRPSTALACSS